MSLTPERWAQVKEAFADIHEAPAADRDALLAAIDIRDAQLADEVRSLLAAAEETEGILQGVAVDALETMRDHAARLIGQQLGAYTVTREIGRGGMGVVYEAHKVGDTFAKRVAVKTLSIGVQRPELLWRFRRERQILAGLEHPNITALYDGGTTDDGVPYLVMEYVDGTRIDAWCETQQLTVRERLDLFRSVCNAVQYAHSKLIVHRDLKPNNILVTHDGVAKLLDFGVAKLLAPDDDRLETTHGAAPLTAAYASPEQLRGEAITTATDVYSLGVVLYRLLTGSYPHDTESKSAAEAISIVSSQAPRSPSQGVQPHHAPSVGNADARTLRATLSGELDAILLMSLRREPERRYATVQALSDDLHRYLKGQTVLARPDTLGYRLRTFARRQRALVAGIGIAVGALIVGTALALRSAAAANASAARSDRIVTFLQDIVGAGDNTFGGSIRADKDITLREILDSTRLMVARQFPREPGVRARLYSALGRSYRRFNRFDEALALLDSGVILHQQTLGDGAVASARDQLYAGLVRKDVGQVDSGAALLSAALRTLETSRGAPAADVTLAMVALGQAYVLDLNRADEGWPLITKALERERRSPTPRATIIAVASDLLGMQYFSAGKIAAGDSAFAESIAAQERDPTASREELSTSLVNWGMMMAEQGRHADAERVKRRALAIGVKANGAQHLNSAALQIRLAQTLIETKQSVEARTLIDAALVTLRQATPVNASEVCLALRVRAKDQIAQGDAAGAARTIAEAQPLFAALEGDDRPLLEVAFLTLEGQALHLRRAYVDERRVLQRAADVARTRFGGADPRTARAEQRLASADSALRAERGIAR
jgi:eukaryotic-like serine/threonine-protein kinase